MGAVVGSEEKGAAHRGEGGALGIAAGVEISDHRCRGVGRVALEQLVAIGAVGGLEEDGSADVSHVLGVAIVGGRDVGHHRGAGTEPSSVALPKLVAVRAVVRGEEQKTVGRRKPPEVRARADGRVDIGDDRCPGPGALPELLAVGSVVGGKDRVPPTSVSSSGDELAPAEELMSSTISVPPARGPPVLFQSSMPLVPSSAAKKRVPPRSVRSVGEELAAPGLMFATIVAPVPVLFHSSWPLVPSLAVKYRVPLTLVSSAGDEPPLESG
jgi:hypothetical protein